MNLRNQHSNEKLTTLMVRHESETKAEAKTKIAVKEGVEVR